MTDYRIAVEYMGSTPEDDPDPKQLIDDFLAEVDDDLSVRTITFNGHTYVAERLFPDRTPRVPQSPDWPDFLKALATRCMQREAAHNTKRGREDRVFEFFCGVLQGLILARHPFAEPMSTWVFLILRSRGYAQVEKVGTA